MGKSDMEDNNNLGLPFSEMQERLHDEVPMPVWYQKFLNDEFAKGEFNDKDVVERKREYKGKRLQRVKKKKLKLMKLEQESKKHKKKLKRLRKEVEDLHYKLLTDDLDD